ncbi:MAG: cell division protein FtsQ/DivIB [Rhizobiaceae bacterium]
MSSLSGYFARWVGRADAAGTGVSANNVNPLALAVRSRVRSFGRRLDGVPAPRTGPGTSLALGFIIAGWFYGSVVAGTAPALVSGIGTSVGLQAKDIVLTGQVETSEQDIIAALALPEQGSLLGFDAAGARQRLMELPWIKDVAIRKLYPGKLTVALAEKRAAAVWQHKDRLTVVEQTGKLIAKFGIADLLNNRFGHLPHLVGQGASQSASEILPLVGQYPQLLGRVTSYTRVADRRWDLGLANGMLIMLPETGVESGLSRLAELAAEDRLLERQVDVIDMRLADRVTFRMQPEAAEDRATLVTDRLKAMKKVGREL